MNATELSNQTRELIVDVPDFPKPGIVFKDLTPVFAHGPTMAALAEHFAARYRQAGIDAIVAIESRGFLLGAPIAATMPQSLVLVRKPGKLPRKTRSVSYELEYGTDTLEMHEDALKPGMKVAVIDDLLATGGTAAAACELVKAMGADIVEVSFLVELAFLSGRTKLADHECFALVTY